MHVCCFSTQGYERPFLQGALGQQHKVLFLAEPLTPATAGQASGSQVVSLFVNDDAGAATLNALYQAGVRHLALRCSGYNHVDLAHACALGMRVAHVPGYSPAAVAEHTVLLLLAVVRRLRLVQGRTQLHDYRLDGATGFCLQGKTAGVIGTGRIGAALCRILHGFGCHLLAYDISPDSHLSQEFPVTYVPCETLLAESDLVSLHVPLTPQTHHLINGPALARMKAGVVLVNTARGAVVDTQAVVKALASRRLGGYGADVYERERGLFFEDHSLDPMTDQDLACLQGSPNVILTPHMGFLTNEALTAIATCTAETLACWAQGRPGPSDLC